MGYFSEKKMETISVDSRYPKFPPKFSGDVEVIECTFKEKCRKSNAAAYIVACRVLSTNDPNLVQVGATRSWLQSLKEEETGLKAVKGFLFGVFGINPGSNSEAEKRINDNVGKLADASVTAAQPLKGQRAHVETYSSPFKDNPNETDPAKMFTKANWSPVSPANKVAPAQAAA